MGKNLNHEESGSDGEEILRFGEKLRSVEVGKEGTAKSPEVRRDVYAGVTKPERKKDPRRFATEPRNHKVRSRKVEDTEDSTRDERIRGNLPMVEGVGHRYNRHGMEVFGKNLRGYGDAESEVSEAVDPPSEKLTRLQEQEEALQALLNQL